MYVRNSKSSIHAQYTVVPELEIFHFTPNHAAAVDKAIRQTFSHLKSVLKGFQKDDKWESRVVSRQAWKGLQNSLLASTSMKSGLQKDNRDGKGLERI